MSRYKFLFLFLSSSICAAAQSSDSIRNLQLEPVTVTGSYSGTKSQNSLVDVNVISIKELENSQVTSLTDALSRLSPSMTVMTNGMGTFLNFNGVSDDYVLVLVDGKRVSGDDRWSRINLNDIKHIEVLSGAASAIYGSDAIAGVVNIITKSVGDSNSIHATSNTHVMNHGRLDQDVTVSFRLGKVVSETDYSFRRSDNWQVNHFQEFLEGDSSVLRPTGRPMSVAYVSNYVNEKLDFVVRPELKVYVRGNYYDYYTRRPQSATYFSQKTTTDKTTGSKSYSYSEKAAYTYDLHHVSYLYGGGVAWTPSASSVPTSVTVDAYSDNFESEYEYWPTDERDAYDETRKRTHYTNESVRGDFDLSDFGRLSAGIECVQENLTSESDNIRREGSNTFNVFAQDEVDLNSFLKGGVGVRYTYNDNFGSNWTPNIALMLHFKAFKLRASYAGGYRTPTLSQMYATDQAKTSARYTLFNTSLKPEKNNYFTANAEFSDPSLWLRASVSAYLNKIRDMINYRTLSQSEIDSSPYLASLYDEGWTTIRQRDNIDDATIKCLNFNAKVFVPVDVIISLGYTLTNSEARTKTLNVKTQTYEVSKSPVDKSVHDVANVSVAWDHSFGRYHLNVSADGHIQSRRYSSTYGYADGFSQWNLMTSHSVSFNKLTISASVGLDNILDKKDNSYWNSNYSTISPGRSAVASLKISFDK